MRQLFAKHKADIVFALLTGFSVALLFLSPASAQAGRIALTETFVSGFAAATLQSAAVSSDTQPLLAENARLNERLRRHACDDAAAGWKEIGRAHV